MYADQQQQPQVQQIPVAYVDKTAINNHGVFAGLFGCCSAVFFTPFIALFGLFYWKEPRNRALLILFAGIGGLSWVCVWFPLGWLIDRASRDAGTPRPDDCYKFHINNDNPFNLNMNDSSQMQGATDGNDKCSGGDDSTDSTPLAAIALYTVGAIFVTLCLVLIVLGSVKLRGISKNKVGEDGESQSPTEKSSPTEKASPTYYSGIQAQTRTSAGDADPMNDSYVNSSSYKKTF